MSQRDVYDTRRFINGKEYGCVNEFNGGTTCYEINRGTVYKDRDGNEIDPTKGPFERDPNEADKPTPSTVPPEPPSTGALVGRLIGGLIGNAVQGRNVLDPRGFPVPPSLLGGVVGGRRPNDLREQVIKILEENKKRATGTTGSQGGVLTGETPDLGKPEMIELEVEPFEGASRETLTDFLFKRAGAADVGKSLALGKDYKVGPGATPMFMK